MHNRLNSISTHNLMIHETKHLNVMMRLQHTITGEVVINTNREALVRLCSLTYTGAAEGSTKDY
jgi:hypothetical protein